MSEEKLIIEKNKSIREKTYEMLKKMIVDGTIAPGERIKEIEYSEKFQISRTPIREAIRMLELEGFVENKKTGGVIVREVHDSELYEIYKIRIALENIMLEEVVKHATSADIKKLEKIINETQQEMANENTDNVFILFSQFNSELYKISKLKKVSEMVQNITIHLKKIRKLSIEDVSRKEAAFNDHKEMVEKIKRKDIENLLKLNQTHLSRSLTFVAKLFNK
jgi:DNA-binding GntR family transcriptional regulator